MFSAFRILRPRGLLLIFDCEGPPILSDGSTTTGVRAWSDAFARSLRRAGLTPFNLERVMGLLRNEEVVGSDMSVPIGHGEGASTPFPPRG